jgi:hypothetical protein
MAAKVKKTTTKKKKATLKSSKKTAKKVKSVSKASSKPKKVAKIKTAGVKATKKVSSKKASAKKVSSKKVSTKKAAPKAQKGLLTKLVGKLTGSSSKTATAKKAKVKATPVEKKASAKNQKQAVPKVTPVKKVKEPTKASEEAAAKVSQKNIAELTQEFAEKKISAASEVLLTDAEGRVLCKFSGCDEIANVEGYCRYHYLLNWKRIQLKKKILSEGKLEKYINELTAKYPDKYIDMLKGDLKSEKDFLSVVNELEIDDSDSSMNDDEEDSYIEQEVQGVSSGKRSNDEDY